MRIVAPNVQDWGGLGRAMQARRDRFEVPARRRKRIVAVVSVLAFSLGLLMLVGVGAYHGYAEYGHSQLRELNASAESPMPSTREGAEVASVGLKQAPPNNPTHGPNDEPASAPGHQAAAQVAPAPDRSPAEPESPSGPAPANPEDPPQSTLIYAPLYPAYQLHPKYWSQPTWAGTDSYSHGDPGLPRGYAAISASDAGALQANTALAQRIRIPAIGVDSAVTELRVVDPGDSRAYETPDNVVGHIPRTANPGGPGNGWYFGHLESPIRGEGNVFHRLPEIAELLKQGDPVYVTVESAAGEFLYQAISSQVLHPQDLSLYGTEDASITLVSCVPRLVYDRRLLVTAKLIGVKLSGQEG